MFKFYFTFYDLFITRGEQVLKKLIKKMGVNNNNNNNKKEKKFSLKLCTKRSDENFLLSTKITLV